MFVLVHDRQMDVVCLCVWPCETRLMLSLAPELLPLVGQPEQEPTQAIWMYSNDPGMIGKAKTCMSPNNTMSHMLTYVTRGLRGGMRRHEALCVREELHSTLDRLQTRRC